MECRVANVHYTTTWIFPFNLDDPSKHIRTLKTHYNMHRCIDPTGKYALYILDSDCPKPATTARIFIQDVVAERASCDYLTTIEGERGEAVYETNYQGQGIQLQWTLDGTPCSKEVREFESSMAKIWLNNEVLDKIRAQAGLDQVTTTKSGRHKPRS